jgi:hypothetical protein
MRSEDPLEDWLYLDELDLKSAVYAARLEEMRAGLDRLEAYLKRPKSKQKTMWEVGIGGGWLTAPLPPAEVARAEALYRQVYAVGGTGSTDVQEGLLKMIAASQNPASIPFWNEMLNLTRPRDKFTRARRRIAVAALAYLALGDQSVKGEDALRHAARHANPEVRALAVYEWGRVYQIRKRPLSAKVAAEVERIAAKDAAFGPRFQARQVLRAARRKVPLDNPGGAYAFRVRFKYAKSLFSRTIELRSKQTLEDLHHAIQRAIHWDADHLYSFFMSGDEDDDLYRFSCPYEEDYPPWTHEAVIGALGLVVNHKFLYLFDYGDNHRFEVEVVGLTPQAERGKGTYPRVIESTGEAPEQYG